MSGMRGMFSHTLVTFKNFSYSNGWIVVISLTLSFGCCCQLLGCLLTLPPMSHACANWQGIPSALAFVLGKRQRTKPPAGRCATSSRPHSIRIKKKATKHPISFIFIFLSIFVSSWEACPAFPRQNLILWIISLLLSLGLPSVSTYDIRK